MYLYKSKIERALSEYFEKLLAKSYSDPSIKEIVEVSKEFTLRGGKRIRPILVILGYRAAGGKNLHEIIKASLSVELMQSFLLVHDDIIDNDDLRRGKLTVHKYFEKKYRNKELGKSIGIIVGDYLSMLGTDIILKTKFSEENKNRAIIKFSNIIINTLFGELLDVQSSLNSRVDQKDIMNIHKLKTAVYTVEGPLHIGAILAGADKKTLKKLSDYAIPVGRAFQIQDDMLGIFGSKKEIGKSVTSDLKEGKKTLLLYYALKKGSASQKDQLKQIIGKEKITMKELRTVRQIMLDTGSYDYSLKFSLNLINTALREINNSDFNEEIKSMLIWIANYVVKRKN